MKSNSGFGREEFIFFGPLSDEDEKLGIVEQ